MDMSRQVMPDVICRKEESWLSFQRMSPKHITSRERPLFITDVFIQSAHYGAKLNDNLDGTLSETAAGSQDYVIRNGHGKSTMVVSQGPLSLVDFPLAEPRLPSKTKQRAASSEQGVTRKNFTAGYSYDTWIGKNS
jgi:hypothetical protein